MDMLSQAENCGFREVHSPAGAFRGRIIDGISCFRAVPYALPPVGELRFAPPVPAPRFEGVRDALEPGAVPPQLPSDLDRPMGPGKQPRSEDCLTLSVWTPSTEGKLPVAVWLHGGANCYGGADEPWYDGRLLAKASGCVVVNIGFRLGVLGFLYLRGAVEKTLCIEDQICALRWIKDNIAAFGGDPERVTLFGQSAGANSIAHLMSRPDTDGLFSAAVLQSCSLGRGNHTEEDADAVGRAVLTALGIEASDPQDILRELRSRSVSELLKASEAVPASIKARHGGMIFKPVDGSISTPELTVRAAAEGAVRRGLRLMVGFTRDEVLAFTEDRSADTLKALAEIQRARFTGPGLSFAGTAAQLGCEVYLYSFEWSAPDSAYGSCHCFELPFLFGNREAWSDAPFLAGAREADFARLTPAMQSAWGAFFRDEAPLDGKLRPVSPEDGAKLIKNMEFSALPSGISVLKFHG